MRKGEVRQDIPSEGDIERHDECLVVRETRKVGVGVSRERKSG